MQNEINNIFALGPTNNIAIEWNSTFINGEGEEFHSSSVTIIQTELYMVLLAIQ